jgi:predicted nucleotidyltransferase
MNSLKIRFYKKEISRIAKKYKIVFVILFGSRARMEKPNSETDLDIAVLAKKETDYKLFGKLFSEFSDVFRGENVDVRFLNGSNLLFRHSVVRDGILLYGDENKYLEYKLLTIKRYVDDGRKYFPALRILIDRKLENLQKGLASPEDVEIFLRLST